MEDQTNPFEIPKAELESAIGSRVSIYSPGQVTAGSFLGGPLVGVYFLYRTFKGMKQEAFASRTLIGGSVFVLALMALLPFLPSHFPKIAIPLAYSLTAKEIANRCQMKKQDIEASDQYRLFSNWRVAVEIVLGLVIFMILMIIWMLLWGFFIGRP